MVKPTSHHDVDCGSIPTSPLQIKPRELNITLCSVKEVRAFIEEHHYSKSINGVKVSYTFKVSHGDELVGSVLFGQMSTTAWKKFADSEHKVVELRRLVLLDKLDKNSESRVIGFCLRYLKKHASDIEVVVSYADPLYNHRGIIYKATNFEFVGLSGKDKGYVDSETGKVYHSRALRTKYNGEYKPFVKRLRARLVAGLLKPIELPPKYCYIYNMN